MPAKVIPIGQPVNDSERQAIAFLRDNLPNDYVILHNFEIADGTRVYEIDLALLTPHCVFVVDIKGTAGQVDVYGNQWHPTGRIPFYSPLAKLRQHAKLVKHLIEDAYPARRELKDVYVQEAVLLTAPNAKVTVHTGPDNPAIIVNQSRSLALFKSKAIVPSGRSTTIGRLLPLVESAIRGRARPQPSKLPQFREWVCQDKLGATDRYVEYRARHALTGRTSGTTRLRFYFFDPYQSEAERIRSQNIISNPFRTLSQMPAHPNIITVRDFFQNEDGDGFVLVTDDISGAALRQHIERPEMALTFDQKVRVMKDVLSALEHAKTYGVVHRNLTPDVIILTDSGRSVLVGFDYGRVENRGSDSTVGLDVIDDLDERYQAVECYKQPSRATPISDLFSAGLAFYELLAGEYPFSDRNDLGERGAVFPVRASEHQPDLPPAFDEWLQKLAAFKPNDRFIDAGEALRALENILKEQVVDTDAKTDEAQLAEVAIPPDPRDLPKDFMLGNRFVVQEKLGKGGAGTVYRVYDTFGDMVCALKLVTNQSGSPLEWGKREYRSLLGVNHPNVVRVIWADVLGNLNNTPFILFEYLDGLSIQEFIDAKAISLYDVRYIAEQAAQGLAYLHAKRIYHQDIKPTNLLWTADGVKIIDFNVAVSHHDPIAIGGTRKYIPPDFDTGRDPTHEQMVDRDLYGLGITLYLCATAGEYPFEQNTPQPGIFPRNLGSFQDLEDLSPKWIEFLTKLISPKRADRFKDATAVINALAQIGEPRLRPVTAPPITGRWSTSTPNFNPFVRELQRLYSQSKLTNAGTRGLDDVGRELYVPTLLDTELQPAILRGEFRLIIMTGNAGDGKTAFIQQFEYHAEGEGARGERVANGTRFKLGGRVFLSNYDGSQDEGDKTNEHVLLDFFSPFQGIDESDWTDSTIRLIAINEGRLIDFLTHYEGTFPRLMSIVRGGLKGGEPHAGVVVINLNLRSVVADAGGQEKTVIIEQLLKTFIAPQYWQACLSCDIHNKCYIYHNVQTFSDPVAGQKIFERLKMLFVITHLRNRLHITLRDLRSALAFMLAGTRDCDGVHSLYASGEDAIEDVVDGYYFNAWMGGRKGSPDRLIALMRQIDIGEVSNPELDRNSDLLRPDSRGFDRFTFSEREPYDDEIFRRLFARLETDYSADRRGEYFQQHQHYTMMMRRRHYFEWRVPDRWKGMLPYRKVEQFLSLVRGSGTLESEIGYFLEAINRAEGFSNVEKFRDKLAFRVHDINKGTIRSYRLFDIDNFTLEQNYIGDLRFLEYMPSALLFRFNSPAGNQAEIEINLDVYEMLSRLREGYVPSIEEREGFYRTLAVFRNVLLSAPYQDVMLTETGTEFYEVSRGIDGVLSFAKLGEAKSE